MPDYTLSQLVTTDDATFFNGAPGDANWQWVGRHNTATTGPWSGYRFDLSPLAGVNVNNITSVVITFKANIAAPLGIDSNIIVEQTPAAIWTGSTANRTRERFQANNMTTNPPVRWTTGAIVAGGTVPTPNLADRVKAALNNGSWNYATDRLGVICGTVGGGAGTLTAQLWSRNVSTVSLRPVMTVSVSTVIEPPPPGDVTIPVSAYQNANTFGNPVFPSSQVQLLNQSYHDLIGNPNNRTFNLWKPPGATPVGGWPTVVWVHGGSFIGGGNTPNSAFRTICANNGWAIASPQYKFTKTDIFSNNIGWTHTSPVQDVICFLKHIVTNKGSLGLNTDLMVMTGESAGGHIGLEAALLLEDANRDTYPMSYRGVNTNRNAIFPFLNVTQGRTGLPTGLIKGMFSWAGPVDLRVVHSSAATGLAKTAMCLYLGQKGNLSFPTATNGEGNLNDYISSKVGSCYDARPLTAPPWPIGYAEHTDDIVVPPLAGLTPLRAALNVVGYDTTAANGVVNLDGLSYRSASYGDAWNAHGAIMNAPQMEFFRLWMTELMASL